MKKKNTKKLIKISRKGSLSCALNILRENQTCTTLRFTISHRLCPQFPCGGKLWIHTGNPVEIVGLPTETASFPGLQNGQLALGKSGGEGDTTW